MIFGIFQIEEDSKRHKAKPHYDIRRSQEKLPTSPVHKHCTNNCGHHLDHADNYCGDARVQRGTSVLENCSLVKDNGIDTTWKGSICWGQWSFANNTYKLRLLLNCWKNIKLKLMAVGFKIDGWSRSLKVAWFLAASSTLALTWSWGILKI